MSHTHSAREYPGQIAGIAIASVLIGAVSAIMLTPKRGSEMRKDLRRRAMTMRKRVLKSDTVTKTKRQAKTTANNMKAETKQATSKAKTAARRTKRSADKVADEIRRNGEP